MAANDAQGDHPRIRTTVLRKQSSCHHDAARQAAMELITSKAVPSCLKAAIELGVFEILAKGGGGGGGGSLTAKEIADQVVRAANGTVINDGYLQRILRVLASENVVSESVVTVAAGNSSSTQRRYALQPIGKYFVRGEDGLSLAPLLLMNQDWVSENAWQQISASVLDNSVEPFKRAHGQSAFQYNRDHPRFDKIFNDAMASFSRLYMQAVLGVYSGFQDVNCLVDVGGGHGSCLGLITGKYPHIRGINFDLPHVIAAAPAYPGVEHVGGEMFDSVPSGDAIFMKNILHDWNDEECVMILRNCFKALPASGGKVIAVDTVLPASIPQSELGSNWRTELRIDVTMLAYNSAGAKERTLDEFRQLAEAVGFTSLALVDTVDFLSVMEFTKA